MSPTPHRQPTYRRIADELREQIKGMEPGDRLPTEPELRTRFGCSRITVRDGLEVLRKEGLIYSQSGRGTFVRHKQPAMRVASQRYRDEQVILDSGSDHPPETAFTREHGISWDEFTVDTDYAEVPAPDDIAARLGIAPGTPVLERRITLYARDDPQQHRTSYYEAALVRGTPAADPEQARRPGGTMAELAALGFRVVRVPEQIRPRMPSPGESNVLDVPDGVPVLEVVRTFVCRPTDGDEAERPVETDVQVMPGDRTTLAYEVRLDV